MHVTCVERRRDRAAVLTSEQQVEVVRGDGHLEQREEVSFFFQAEDGIRDVAVTGVQTCALPISFPSNTARGGVLYPIVLSLAQNSGSMPDQKNRRMGGYLMFCGMASLSVSSALWLTATSGNPIAVSLAERYGVKINFGSWIVAASIPILTMIVFLPLMLN